MACSSLPHQALHRCQWRADNGSHAWIRVNTRTKKLSSDIRDVRPYGEFWQQLQVLHTPAWILKLPLPQNLQMHKRIIHIINLTQSCVVFRISYRFPPDTKRVYTGEFIFFEKTKLALVRILVLKSPKTTFLTTSSFMKTTCSSRFLKCPELAVLWNWKFS